MPGIAPEWPSSDYNLDDLPDSSDTSGWVDLVAQVRETLVAADYDAWVERQLAQLTGEERQRVEGILRPGH